MIETACRQSSYLLPLLTNSGHMNNKMKRVASNDEFVSTSTAELKNDHQKKILPPRKKLKFGVAAILGTNSDNESSLETGNDSDEDLKHKGEYTIFFSFEY